MRTILEYSAISVEQDGILYKFGSPIARMNLGVVREIHVYSWPSRACMSLVWMTPSPDSEVRT